MTLPEHAICSLMLAQFQVRERYGWKGVAAVVVAGIAPDWDVVTKLFGDKYFWNLHHALGHGLLPMAGIGLFVGWVACRFGQLKPRRMLLIWCLLASLMHGLTDTFYWWGVHFLWPFSDRELSFNWLEYLDLIVLGLWLGSAAMLYFMPQQGRRIATYCLAAFTGYVTLRACLPRPAKGSLFDWIAGGWMYEVPQGTPGFEWW